MTYFEVDTLHVLNRHPKPQGFRGYLAALTPSSMILYIITSSMLLTTLIVGLLYADILSWNNNWLMLPYSVIAAILRVDEFPQFKSIDALKTGQWSILLIYILAFTFNTFYQLDAISNITEPTLETLPRTFHEIQTMSQHLTQVDIIPHFEIARTYNLKVLKTPDLSKFKGYFKSEDWLSNLMNIMIHDPNFFVLIYKTQYLRLLVLKGKPNWMLRLSDEEIATQTRIVMARKYEPWWETFNLVLLKIHEGDLLLPTRETREILPHRINPHKVKFGGDGVTFVILRRMHFAVQ